MIRVPLLALTAGVAGLGALANTMEAAATATPGAAQTRLGSQIAGEISGQRQREAQRSRSLDLKEQALKAVEARVRAQAEAQLAAQTQAQPAADGTSADDKRYDDLAQIYQSMKPAKAAAVFEQLEPEVQLRIAQRMRERSTGQIMAAMSPTAAASLSGALARGSVARPTRKESPKRVAARGN